MVSDLTPGLDGAPIDVGADHVLGISSASSSLAQLTVREPFARALDLGTGCGVQALHLAEHVDDVVATDVNERALAMTRLNAALNGVRVDVRAGSLFEPVAGERFDLVVTNPPFVVSPATDARLVYRDSGLPGDEVVRRVVTQAPAHLNPGGWAQVLANWVHRRGEPWQDRIGGWLTGSGCDAWVVQREVADLAEYVELWLKDAGVHGRPDYARRYDAWLAWFDEQDIEAVGFGWLHLRRTGPPGPRAGAAPGGVALRGRAAARPRGRRPGPSYGLPGGDRRRGAARQPARRPGRRAPGERRARSGRATRRPSCCASSAGCDALGRPTRSRPVWSGPVTGTSRSARSWTPWPRSWTRTPPPCGWTGPVPSASSWRTGSSPRRDGLLGSRRYRVTANTY